MSGISRRGFLGASAAGAAMSFIPSTHAAPVLADLPDTGWMLWLDRDAAWRDDAIHLPSQVNLHALPLNPPTGGWGALWKAKALAVTLPTTVEEHFWGAFGERSYTGDEYRYAEDDAVPQNGAYRGVSWWYREIDIPASARGKRVMLHIRGARLRAEVFLNERLVGYSIMSELPIHCDLTQAMRPGQANRLAIRITNPGGRYDWRDSTTMMWGAAKLFASHGFGGIDRGMTLSAHPLDAHIADAWVLNTPNPREVTAHMQVVLASARDMVKLRGRARVELVGVKGVVKLESISTDANVATFVFRVKAPDAKLWDLETPHLHQLRFGFGEDRRTVRFGFRWFSPEGIGTNALLRLNGRRVKLYSAISWGYWGYNGLWPTPELARREVTAAKALGLNCLHFHRNVGKEEVFAAQDAGGLLRVMEPGGGRHAIGRDLKPGETLSDADRFSRDFLVEKCVAMAKTFRSHPSLVQYTLQNEIGANLANPDVQAVLRAIHDADPSRTVILNDGFVQRGAAQAMILPYSDHTYRSDVEQWGGWWVNHQGAGDQWYDKFYQSKDAYIHQQAGKPFIVEFGEMQGCAVADNHAGIVAEIDARGGKSYDIEDHRVILRETEAFLDRWGFRKAFPTAESLFLSIGRKAYHAWENYFENIRLGDNVDMACVSGWETTAIENHSGVVDNLRHFKTDPEIIRRALLPVRPCAKQRRLVYALGETAELDIWLFDDTGGTSGIGLDLILTMIGPDGRELTRASFPTPARFEPDVFAYLIEEKAKLFPFDKPGKWTIRLAHTTPDVPAFERDFWVVGPAAPFAHALRIGVAGVAQSLRKQLDFAGVAFEDFRPGQRYDGVIASGLRADEIARRQVGEQTGLEAQPRAGEKPPMVLGELPAEVLAAVKTGTPLLALVPEDGLADGVAKQLSALGLFRYAGQVGNLRAPWMGNWNYLRAHPLFEGIPADCATSVLHQVEGQPSNGLIVDGEGVEIVAAYSRDHDRRNGAATLIARANGMHAVVHRMPDMVQPLQRRFLENAVRWLAGVK
ncbi:twin-arginine translocation signal domain-containing protein [Sphingomonas sp. LB-2]|uniref:sugar-binding domain-containing protein n=1 Tax=Sphingomonas caeni TaxID=2984949 RepID=UPI00222EAA81|nr:sugar-binding domain-containing protein [Sphingomonas caeni]MCW3847390.1 twin-arginine translocation signal domain-containing protein [Sphingomonas caeni]